MTIQDISFEFIKKLLVCFLVGLMFLRCNKEKPYESHPIDEADPASDLIKDNSIYRDIIADFENIQKEKITKVISANNTPPSSKLLWGWKGLGNYARNPNLVINSKIADLVFFSQSKSKVTIKLNCRINHSKESKGSKLGVFINQKYVRYIELVEAWKTFDFVIEPDFIKMGQNILTFEVIRPAPSKDDILPTISFSQISFHYEDRARQYDNPLPLKQESHIVQFPGSFLIYYDIFPQNGRLFLNLKSVEKGTTAHVIIETDSDTREHIVFSKPESRVLNLPKFYNKYVRITLSVAHTKIGEEKNSRKPVLWSDVKIITPKGKANSKPMAQQRLEELMSRLKRDKLDVVYIILDALNAKHTSLHGYERKTTPFLQTLGKEAVVFENFFANSPYTLASTGTLLTSKYPHQHALINAESSLRPGMSNITNIMAESDVESFLLTEHPYLTGKKWGIANCFSNVFGKEYGEWKLESMINDLEKIYSKDMKHDKSTVPKHKFVYMHLIPPHIPFNPPMKYRIFGKKNKNDFGVNLFEVIELENNIKKQTEENLLYYESMYDANILYADSLVRRIYEFYKRNRLLERTVLIVTSDHGEASDLTHGHLGHTTQIFDEMLHIPFLVKFPERYKRNDARIKTISSVVDVPPTILELMGLNTDPGFEGKSALSMIVDEKKMDRNKYIYLDNPLLEQRGIRNLVYKYIEDKDNRMLFDLRNDPNELTNIYRKRRVVSGYFRQLIRKEFDYQEWLSQKRNQKKRSVQDGSKKTPKKKNGREYKLLMKRLKALGYVE